MTDREHDGIKGKVKTVEVSSQRIGSDGNPVEEPKTDTETAFDEEGNMTHSSTFHMGQYRTTYFRYKERHVSKSELIGGDRSVEMSIPNGFTPAHTLNKNPFDYEYKYHYDRDGRIIEISGHASHGTFVSHDKYVYDDAGRIVSETNASAHGGDKLTRSYKYDEHGNEIEMSSHRSTHTVDGVKQQMTMVHYGNYALDKDGNWTHRTATVLNGKGEVESVTLIARQITYY
jgi:YD repeat-containing protein